MEWNGAAYEAKRKSRADARQWAAEASSGLSKPSPWEKPRPPALQIEQRPQSSDFFGGIEKLDRTWQEPREDYFARYSVFRKGHGTMLAAKLAISDEDRAMLARANRVLHKEQPQSHSQQRRESFEDDETSPNLLSCFGVRSKKSGSGNSSYGSNNGSGNVYVERETRVRFDSKPDIRRAQTSPWASTPTLNRSTFSPVPYSPSAPYSPDGQMIGGKSAELLGISQDNYKRITRFPFGPDANSNGTPASRPVPLTEQQTYPPPMPPAKQSIELAKPPKPEARRPGPRDRSATAPLPNGGRRPILPDLPDDEPPPVVRKEGALNAARKRSMRRTNSGRPQMQQPRMQPPVEQPKVEQKEPMEQPKPAQKELVEEERPSTRGNDLARVMTNDDNEEILPAKRYMEHEAQQQAQRPPEAEELKKALERIHNQDARSSVYSDSSIQKSPRFRRDSSSASSIVEIQPKKPLANAEATMFDDEDSDAAPAPVIPRAREPVAASPLKQERPDLNRQRSMNKHAGQGWYDDSDSSDEEEHSLKDMDIDELEEISKSQRTHSPRVRSEMMSTFTWMKLQGHSQRPSDATMSTILGRPEDHVSPLEFSRGGSGASKASGAAAAARATGAPERQSDVSSGRGIGRAISTAVDEYYEYPYDFNDSTDNVNTSRLTLDSQTIPEDEAYHGASRPSVGGPIPRAMSRDRSGSLARPYEREQSVTSVYSQYGRDSMVPTPAIATQAMRPPVPMKAGYVVQSPVNRIPKGAPRQNFTRRITPQPEMFPEPPRGAVVRR